MSYTHLFHCLYSLGYEYAVHSANYYHVQEVIGQKNIKIYWSILLVLNQNISMHNKSTCEKLATKYEQS